ncbi:hypothetical protein Nmel_000642, partial [Mimus melanotis]
IQNLQSFGKSRRHPATSAAVPSANPPSPPAPRPALGPAVLPPPSRGPRTPRPRGDIERCRRRRGAPCGSAGCSSLSCCVAGLGTCSVCSARRARVGGSAPRCSHGRCCHVLSSDTPYQGLVSAAEEIISSVTVGLMLHLMLSNVPKRYTSPAKVIVSIE